MALTKVTSSEISSTTTFTFGNVTVSGNVTTGNISSSGFFWANGAPFSSGSAGVTAAKVYGLNIAFGIGL